MDERAYLCQLAGKLAHRHGYGKPIHRDQLIRYANIPRDKEGEAKDAFEQFRKMPFIQDLGDGMVKVDNSEFGSMIEFLHNECDWPESDLRLRFHHFEGWTSSTWSSPSGYVQPLRRLPTRSPVCPLYPNVEGPARHQPITRFHP